MDARNLTHKFAQQAWDIQWKDRLEQRAKGHDFRGHTYFITAVDIEAQLRRFAQEISEAKPIGSTGVAYGFGWYLNTVRISGNLKDNVRDWLLRNPRLEKHNFGRGHISGMRFRPVGQPLGPGEKKTLEEKAERKANPRPRPRHYSEAYGRRPLCTKKRTAGHYSYYRGGRPNVWTTSVMEEVTCRACQNLLAAGDARVGKAEAKMAFEEEQA